MGDARRPAGVRHADDHSVLTPQLVRELLQVIGEVLGAVELDQPTDERTNDDVQFDEPVHGGHSAVRTEQTRDALLARMRRNAAGRSAHDVVCRFSALLGRTAWSGFDACS